MNFSHRNYGRVLQTLLLAVIWCTGVSSAQDYASMGISDVVVSADRLLQRGDYKAATPALREVLNRTASLTDMQGMETAQNCRFQLARVYYQMGDIASGMTILDEYLENEPLTKERVALRMMAQGYFETQEWEKIEEITERLIGFPDLEKEERYNANLLLGQARFRLEKWQDSVDPLAYASEATEDKRIGDVCRIMVVRALVEAENWRELFGWIPRIYRTDSKYNISLNLSLMKAGKARFEDDDYLNALLLYRMVLPREKLLDFANEQVRNLTINLEKSKKIGVAESDIKDLENEITDIKESIKVLSDLPPYEQEVTFRIGQIYAEVKRYWESYVLFDKLYRDDRNSEIGEASMLQSVLILYDVGETARAEERILVYLEEKPDGEYARTLLSMMIRDNLINQNFKKIIGFRPKVEGLPPAHDFDEKALQADLHYMMAFAYFQSKDYKLACGQFSIVLDRYPKSTPVADSRYFRGMTYLLQTDYANALDDFKNYQKLSEFGEHFPASVFREAVCLFGLEKVPEAESTFTQFIEKFPDDVLVSEAYSMRGDIEAAKVASNEDPYTLDRALADYRKGIDKASTSEQAAYAAFQAAKVYRLEYKWQEIIDLMNYYIDRWEEKANVAEAVFWIGQSQIKLGQIADAVEDYLAAIERFGDDPLQEGVDKIILELVDISNNYLSDEDREGLAVKVKLKLTSINDQMEVLRLRLQVAQSFLQGEEVAKAFGEELLNTGIALEFTTPASLSLMCDAAVDRGKFNEISRLYDYFISTFEESDMLWHAYRAYAQKLLVAEDYQGVLATIDEAQGVFGAEPFMSWAQLLKADTQFKLENFEAAEKEYNMILGIPEWRGPIFAEAMYSMGQCRLESGDLETAHSFFQRTYLLFKGYSDGDWSAKGYLAAADVLIKLGREDDAVNTLKAMLEDVYTNTNPLAEQVREQLKKYGGQQ